MVQESDDRVGLLIQLEQPRTASPLDEAAASSLVEYALASRSEWWASKALDWVDQGVWTDDVAAAARRVSQDKTYSQQTRHRAWKRAKPRAEGQPASADDNPG